MADNIKHFVKEQDFEEALTALLMRHGWNEVIMNPSEKDLVRNWADILYSNNREIDKLGNYPLTESEMQQVLSQVNRLDSPYLRNRFINGGLVSIKRDNAEDSHNYGKEVYLKIFDPREIQAGQSRYQIVRQPRFQTSDAILGNRRGDLMLLINGMPVIHVELKRSKVDVSQACYQIKRYAHEGIFRSGIFSLVQVFVAMTPDETLYFANPGEESRFQRQYYFHWEDFNNEVVGNWERIGAELLSIPMAHMLVGDYTIADQKDMTLKVLRSYQFFAVSEIIKRIKKTNWDDHSHKGGFIWHTTGSGKTMTSFKCADLVARSNDVDKVVFLLDRIELAVQSLDEFKGFAGERKGDINDTADTAVLLSKLESMDPGDRFIVTSIQKMYLLKEGESIAGGGTLSRDYLRRIGNKRIVFIVDECHRSVFGDMLISIKNTFPRALLFGFTGTPVFPENAKNEITTETLFGDMLHKYTIANAIPDGNVLGFDPYQVNTYDENELREMVAFRAIDKRLAADGLEAEPKERTTEDYMQLIDKDAVLKRIYDHFMYELKMPRSYMENGKTVSGIESYLPRGIYRSQKHHEAVAKDIVQSREKLSHGGMFHAVLATESIEEAITYYKLFKGKYPELHVVAVFDRNIDNSDEGILKEDAIKEMLSDYNARYGTSYALSNYLQYKKDVALRLAHKRPYIGIEEDHARQIDLLIVVTQLLTGYDSKWINTLYVDKVMRYVDIIQAFSRTNRLFGPEKPFGIIKYYAYPYTMKQYIDEAIELYTDQPLSVFVDKLERNLTNINQRFLNIRDIFRAHKIEGFERLPDTEIDRKMFAKLFIEMSRMLEAAKLQGFVWEKKVYEFEHGDTFTKVVMEIDATTYQKLLARYLDLFTPGGDDDKKGDGSDSSDSWAYEIDTFITEMSTGTIDAEYLEAKFRKFIKTLYFNGPGSEETKRVQEELCKAFASLSQKDQDTAFIILSDIQSGELHPEPGKTLSDYIIQYQLNSLERQVLSLSEATGVNSSQLMGILKSDVTDRNINEDSRFDKLMRTWDMAKSRVFLEKVLGEPVQSFMIRLRMDDLLRSFILYPENRKVILNAWFRDEPERPSGASNP